MAAGLYDPAFATLGRLYGAEARGAITALTLWGGFASTVCRPLSALMLDSWGWRGTAAAYAAVHLLVSLPLVLLVIPSAPTAPDASPTPQAALTPPERLVLALMAALLLVTGLIVVNVSTWLFAFLRAQGQRLAEAVALGTLIGPAQVGARVIEMAGRERHHPLWTLAAATVAVPARVILLAPDLGLAGAALILYGGGNGLFSIARGALPLAVFGPARYPAITGSLARPSLVAQAAAPMLGAGAPVALAVTAVLATGGLILLVLIWRAVRAVAGGLTRSGSVDGHV